jgi:hypothetical protein
MIQTGAIEITPLLYMRGRTFKNTLIIADEIQNTTPQQLLMLLTRCGENSKIVVTGDLNQSDLKELNGLQDFIDRHRKTSLTVAPVATPLIKIIQFKTADVQRSELVKRILDIYDDSTHLRHQPPSQPQHPSQPQPLTPPLSSASSAKQYMKMVNNCASKIPMEYGDYITIQQDSALMPKRDMEKTTRNK